MNPPLAIVWIILAVFIWYMVYDGWKIRKDTKKEMAKLLEDQLKLIEYQKRYADDITCYGDYINLGINQRDPPLRTRNYCWVDDDIAARVAWAGGHLVVIGDTVYDTSYFRCDICGANIRVHSWIITEPPTRPDQIQFLDPAEFNRCQGACGCKKITDTAEEHQSP